MGDAREGVCGDTGDGRWSLSPWVEVPADFMALAERLPADLDRRLGYPGKRRFVAFRYESRGEEVIWDDGHTYGFGTGGWSAFLEHVAPLAAHYGVDLGLDGSGSGGSGVNGVNGVNGVSGGAPRPPRRSAMLLLLDREGGCAYFARRDSAERFLARMTDRPV